MIKKAVKTRLVSYGHAAEHIFYKTPLYIHKDDKRTIYTKEAREQRRDDSLSRTRSKLYRYIHSNIRQHGPYPPVFLTLTYKENIADLKQTNRHYKLFIKRLSYKAGHNLRYICIPEFQERGAVHYHAMFFNLPKFTPLELTATWSHGHIRVEMARNIKNLAAYMAKYISKEITDARLKGHRILLTSRGLLKPVTYDNEDVDFFLLNNVILKVESQIVTQRKIIKNYKHTKNENRTNNQRY